MDKKKPDYTNAEIDNVLYSAIRNSTHFKVRVKGYIIKILQNIYLVLFQTKTKNKTDYKKIPTVLNDAPQKEWIKGSDYLNVLKIDNNNPEIRTLFLIEIFLLLAFLLDIKYIQKKLFNIAFKKTSSFVNKHNVEAMVCGHPTILMCFIGVFLRTKDKKVITIQHGIYNLKRYKVLWFEKEVATHIIVYGPYFKELYASQGVRGDIEIGNPYFSSEIESDEKTGVRLQLINKKVLFLGQQLYKVSSQVFKPYNEFLSGMISQLEKKDIQLYYKAHPREDLNRSLSKENIARVTIFEEEKNCKSFLNDFDVYYSINSSLLLETYLQKKICFQIDLPKHPGLDKFSDYSGIRMVGLSNLKTHLDEPDYEFFYDTNYLNISKSPKDSMSTLIAGILNY